MFGVARDGGEGEMSVGDRSRCGRPVQVTGNGVCRAFPESGNTCAILRISVQPERTHNTALTDAVLCSDYDTMQQMIATGADLNAFYEFRMTALLWAIMRGDIAAVRMLLESGADPNARPNPSDSPLWSAEDDWGFIEIAALLRAYGATK
jgi:hypothetical protein